MDHPLGARGRDVLGAAAGAAIARRNLVLSILAEHLGFSIWVLWSIVAVNLPSAGFALHRRPAVLAAWRCPTWSGRPCGCPTPSRWRRFGGRNWTIVSRPCCWSCRRMAGLGGQRPGTSYWMMLLVAATAGVGGGNFASSMTNISYFFPEREKGWALGLNAAGGNIGVAVVQAPYRGGGVSSSAGARHPPASGPAALDPAGAAGGGLAWRYMDNLSGPETDFASQRRGGQRTHTWVMSVLYIGTFGSFIGYAAAFPLLIKGQFPDVTVAHFAFLGALVGSLSRPSRRLARGPHRRRPGDRGDLRRRWASACWVRSARSGATTSGRFLAAFMVLFVATGVGNGSTYRMIPAIFRRRSTPRPPPPPAARPPPRSASSPRSVPTAASSCRAPSAGRSEHPARSSRRCTSTSRCTA